MNVLADITASAAGSGKIIKGIALAKTTMSTGENIAKSTFGSSVSDSHLLLIFHAFSFEDITIK